MNEIMDRRSFDRPNVPAVEASIFSASWYYLLKYKIVHRIVMPLSRKYILQNLSASGSCVLTKNYLVPGKEIYLFLFSPGENTVLIKGIVRWISPHSESNMYIVGTQFLAYGNGRSYNSFKVLEQLHIYALRNTVLAGR